MIRISGSKSFVVALLLLIAGRAYADAQTPVRTDVQTVEQRSPLPTPQQQQGIDRDISRHFGDAPASPGPLADDLSSAMTPGALDHAIRKVADWQLTRAEPYFDRIWTWSVLYTGLMAASRATGDPKYHDAMLRMAERYDWELRSANPNADDQSLGQTYLELYLEAGKEHPEWIAPTRRALDAVIGSDTLQPGDPRIPWWWCDALFMAPPVWARMYAATGEHKYVDYLDRQWQRTSSLLYDPQEDLYARDATYVGKRGPNGQKIFWSRGEGWVMAGIGRTLSYLPAGDPRRGFYEDQLRAMAARVAALQDPGTGLWHASLLDPKDFPAPEISGSALLVYAMAWGINHGVLDRATYLPVVEAGWSGLLHHVYAEGRLGDVQQTGSEPAYYMPSSSYNYGVGGFLLAASELKEMALAQANNAAGPGAAEASSGPGNAAAGSPDLAGIAHVAIRVRDLGAAAAFYEKLGFVRVFALFHHGVIYEAFMKVNDRQFIELYPTDAQHPDAGFLHLCFEGQDLQAVHRYYVAEGLVPTKLRKAGAGNLLFTMLGPITAQGPQNIEYTQYMPGSLHSKEFGRDLGPDRIATRMIAVTLATADPAAAQRFYTDKLGFLSAGRRGNLLSLPGSGGEWVEIAPLQPLGLKARIAFEAEPGQAKRLLRERHITYRKQHHSLVVRDPDGNEVVFEAAPSSAVKVAAGASAGKVIGGSR